MGLYQSKLFLTLDDVADYLADKGICDFDVQNKHEKKRFKDFIQELELMHDLKRLKLIDGEFDVDFSIVEEDKTEDKFSYHLALQLKNYNLAGFFYPNGVNSQDEPCYSALQIMKSGDDYHDGYLSDLLKHYRQVPPELEHLIRKNTLTLSNGKTVTTTRTKVFVTDEGNVYKENGYSSTYKIGVIDSYYRYVDIDINFILKSKYNKSKDYFFINDLEKAIASYQNLANKITAPAQPTNKDNTENAKKKTFELKIDDKKENKLDKVELEKSLRDAIDLAFTPFQSDDYFLENPEPPELKVIDFADDGEQSAFNDSQQQIADLQAENELSDRTEQSYLTTIGLLLELCQNKRFSSQNQIIEVIIDQSIYGQGERTLNERFSKANQALEQARKNKEK
ncbi:hypothetical protein [Moraxella pluranimalium]|uniref:Uncharacterized protein n=1 Tax=Moraxella pluranimalium TaxID=470453 RepID=A0A1T0CBK0_9GAMM|nr:hypothetical protein [Moraxella pluranimalium]OOS19725.1 hypothetical protein B0680_10680 [Moraxella pluranimalium]